LLYQANHGQGYAFNNAIGVSNGNYIAFLDHDDLFTPNKLSLQINYMKDNPDTHLVFGMIEHFISPELPDHIKTIRHCPSEPLPGIAPSTMMFKRECFDILGPFNTTLKVGSHIDWLIRAKEKGFNQYTLPQVVSRRRIHDTNTSIIERHNHGQYIQIIKEKLARERLRNAHNEVYHEK
jgi:glycosyltransferase involved in cell wall biosynthesis